MSPGCGSPTFSSLRIDTTVTASAIGSTAAKISRHEPSCSSTPETAGPSAGATDMASVTLPITRPRSCTGTTVISVVISSGIITAVPLAWMIRATSSTQNVGATSASAVPIENVIIAVAKAVRVRDPLQEPAGDRDHRGHRQQERRREPLGGVQRHIEVLGQTRDRVDHDRLVEDHGERRRDQPSDDDRGPAGLSWCGSRRSHGGSLGVAGGADAGRDRRREENSSSSDNHSLRRAYSGPNEYCGVAE